MMMEIEGAAKGLKVRAAKTISHLGLSAQPPPRTPARRVDLFQAA